MTLTHYTTGSDGVAAICFVEGRTANRDYGVAIRHANMCPNCRTALSLMLSFNPTNSYYYIAPCPSCGQFIIYCDVNGDLVNKFTIVSSGKTTYLDNDVDFPNNWV